MKAASTSLESESGRISIHVYGTLADSLQPKERVLSLSFMEAASCVCTKTSYRDAADILNRFLGRTDINTIKLRTLSDSIGRIGAEISKELSDVTARILSMYGFDDESGLPLGGAVLSGNITAASISRGAKPGNPEIDGIIASVNDSREEKIPFSATEIKIEPVPEECVYVSIDDIGVKHQKDSRKEGSVRDYKYVENTVAHIQYGDRSYILTGIGMRNVFKSVLAFLLVNNLLSRELVFLTDGAQDIRNHIQSVFQFHPYTVILDRFHLKKRCQEWLSMAIRGKDRRNTILEKAFNWFPLLKEMLRMEKLCYAIGFTKDMVNSLLTKKEAIRCNGKIYSEEHRRRFEIKNDIFKIEKSSVDNNKLVLTINRQPIGEWFKEQWEYLQPVITQYFASNKSEIWS